MAPSDRPHDDAAQRDDSQRPDRRARDPPDADPPGAGVSGDADPPSGDRAAGDGGPSPGDRAAAGGADPPPDGSRAGGGVGRRALLALAAGGLAAGYGAVAGQEGTPTPTPTATPRPAGTETPTPGRTPRATATLGARTVTEQRGDVATFEIQLSGTDRARMGVGDRLVNYVATFEVVDADGDGTVTVTMDTVRAGQGETPGFAATGEDAIENYRLRTDPLSPPGARRLDPLETELYPLRLFVGDRLADSGVLVLEERSTEGIDVLVVPGRLSPDEEGFLDAAVPAPGDTVAVGDRAVVEVRASGLYALLSGPADLNTDRTGIVFEIVETGVMNEPDREIPLGRVDLLVRPDENRFLAVLPRFVTVAGREYETTFALTDAYPYVPPGEREEVSTSFVAVERSASFDEVPLALPPGQATVSGTATVAPGTPIMVGLTGEGLLVTRGTTVADDGTWSVDLDLSGVEPGTEFTARVFRLSGLVEGRVVEGAPGTETPGPETPETPGEATPGTPTPETPGEETPEGTPTGTPEGTPTGTPEGTPTETPGG